MEWISIADLNFLARAIGRKVMEDILMISPKRYFSNPKPLRELLPVTASVDVGGEKFVFFLIEQEVAPYLEPDNVFTSAGDSSHFLFPITDYAIPADCISLPEDATELEFIPYFAFQDPTFSESVKARIPKEVLFEVCPQDFEYLDWQFPDLYLINKIIAVFFLRYGDLISPTFQQVIAR